ncbi:MAG TPA: HD domain-containing protein [Phototrophicaceae bacterium]|nr:HD domain-containing protein [Phototrophicaceae bacterium]
MNDLILVWPDVVYDLQERVGQSEVYIVGGAVRDALLRRPIHDLDMAVPSGGIALARRIANQMRGAFVALDADRDVGRAILDTPDGRLLIDVAGFRGSSIEADLRDRDFTINALAVDLRGDLNQVIDPLHGVRDLIGKTLRRCNPESIATDPIRGLRAVRQSIQFSLRIEPETLKDIRANVPRLLDTSIERVRDELFKLLAQSKPVAALRIADRLGLLTTIIPELAPLHDLEQYAPVHAYDVWNHTLAVVESLSEILAVVSARRTDETAAQFNLGMFAVALDVYRRQLQAHFDHEWPEGRTHVALLLLTALLHDIGKGMVTPRPNEENQPRFPDHEPVGAEAAAKRVEALHLSRDEQTLVVHLVRFHYGETLWQAELSPVDIYRYWKRHGEAGIDLIMLALADYLGAKGVNYDQKVWLGLVERAQTLLRAYYEEYERLVEPPVLINGNELMQALGLKPGPIVGELLERIREAQVSGVVTTTDEALRLARDQQNQRA